MKNIQLRMKTALIDRSVGAFWFATKNVGPCTLVYGIPAEEHDDKHGLLGEDILPQFR
jgi:hypothetical protein